ncbi:MAG: S8 family serine peptidase [Thermoleophilia bacterium]|nr:S8 family serine peptidase [Thermoleophilia bacterium]
MLDSLVVGAYASSHTGVRTYIAQLDSTAQLDSLVAMDRGGDRKVAVVNELLRANAETMTGVAPALDALKAQGLIASYEVDALSNSVIYDVPDAKAAESWKAINKIEGIARVLRNREVHLTPVEDARTGAASVTEFPTGNEWNVEKVNAPAVWAQGFNGTGVTVGIVDTGSDVSHPLLHDKYRGTNADGTQSDDYNFHDEVNKKTAPYDDNNHGTHVTGTVLGSTATYDTGIAPGAKFITSKILSGSGSGTMAGVLKGLAWMLAPTKSDGTAPDPTKAPDIISNSWGSNDGKSTAFAALLKSFVAAGIEPVFAAGNAGPRAGSVGSPGSDPSAITVASTDKDDKVSSFSSRGPSPLPAADGSDHKPDISAPGRDITSSFPGGGLGTISGTSMATPAVSGVIALLLSKHKDLTHEEIVKAITTSARDIDAPGWDYNSGAGLIDAAAALKAADALVAARTPH